MTKTAYGINLMAITFFALNGLYFGYNNDDTLMMVFLIPTIVFFMILPACSIKE
tara:strand:- start:404 stop:565 length:162 start_codon:yes stop_codon:yes gene_type:complete